MTRERDRLCLFLRKEWGRSDSWTLPIPTCRTLLLNTSAKGDVRQGQGHPATSRGMTWRYLARKAKDGSVAIPVHIRPDQANNFGGREGGIIGQIGKSDVIKQLDKVITRIPPSRQAFLLLIFDLKICKNVI
jgi:hypothetical protein